MSAGLWASIDLEEVEIVVGSTVTISSSGVSISLLGYNGHDKATPMQLVEKLESLLATIRREHHLDPEAGFYTAGGMT